jgi:hypothetical protein
MIQHGDIFLRANLKMDTWMAMEESQEMEALELATSKKIKCMAMDFIKFIMGIDILATTRGIIEMDMESILENQMAHG